MNEVDFVSDILFGNKKAISNAIKPYVAKEGQKLAALATALEAQLKLKTLTDLLVAKGVITQAEIDAADALAEQSEYGLFIDELNQPLKKVVDLLKELDEK